MTTCADRPPAGPAPLPVAPEDALRSQDRFRVFTARRGGRRWYLLWLLIGPGLLAMLGENDGPSMISYAASGATYGYGFFLPFIVVTFLGAVLIQEMAMRVGAVTHRGYGQLVLQRYGPTWGWLGAADLVLTNLVTLVSEFVAIRVGLAYFHLGAPVAAALGLALVVGTSAGGRYRRWERAALGMAAFNALFLLAAIFSHPRLGAIGTSLATWTPLPGGSVNTLLLLVASTIGATVTPWMIFFQQNAVVDKGMTSRDLAHGRYDTLAGGLLAALFGCAAFVAAARLAGRHLAGTAGLTGAGFPAALHQVSGAGVATLFALGLIEAGALAILTICASTGYGLAECLGVAHSFNDRSRRSLVFYLANTAPALVAAGVIVIPGAPLLAIALNANVLATVLLPVSVTLLLMLANDGELMGRWANSRRTNIAAVAMVVVIAVSGAAYGLDSFLQATGLVGG